MGSAIGAFMQGIQGTLGAKLEKKHDEEEALKKEQRDHLWQVIHDPKTSKVGVKMAADALAKLQNPETRKGFQKILPQLNQIIQRAKQQGQQQSQPAPAPQTQEATSGQLPVGTQVPAQAPMSESLGMPAGTKLPPPTSPRAQFNKGPDFAAMMQGYGDKQAAQEQAKEAYKSKLRIEEDKAKAAAKPPSAAQQKREQMLQDIQKLHPDWDEDQVSVEAARREVEGKPQRATILASDILTPEMAIHDGRVFKRQDGTPIDPTTLSYGTVIQRYHPPGKEDYYDIRLAPTHLQGVNGEIYAFTAATSPEDIKRMMVPVGPKNAATVTTSEFPTIDPATNKTILEKKQSVRVPQNPGISGGRTAAPAQPAPAPTAQKAGGQASPAPAPSGGGQASSEPRELKGLAPGTYNQAVKRAGPIKESANQIYGEGGLKDYASLADDPKARERLATAFNLTFGNLLKAESEGNVHIGASAGPVSVGTGGFGTWLQNALGMPEKVAKQQAQIMEQAVGKLPQKEKDAYNATISALSTVAGLRASFGGLGTEATIAGLQKEVPMIGINGTFSSKDFNNKLGLLAGVTNTAFQSVPDVMIPKDLRDSVEKYKAKKGPAKAPSSGKSEDLKGKSTEDLLRMLAQ